MIRWLGVIAVATMLAILVSALGAPEKATVQTSVAVGNRAETPFLIIDRFEGDYAVLEQAGQIINLPRSLLPTQAKEGDVLRLSLTVDSEKTEQRSQHIGSLVKELFK